jgi:O-antigen/teichoic acid export membrane protein
MPLLLLANTSSATDVAQFAAPFRLADAALFLSIAAGFALLPGLAHVGETERPRALRLIRRSLGAAVVLALATSAALVPLAAELVSRLFGTRFESAAEPARVLVAGLAVYAVVGIGWYSLLALGRERFLLLLALGSAATSVVASAVLVPSGGSGGAAVAYVGSLAVLALGIAAALLTQRE